MPRLRRPNMPFASSRARSLTLQTAQKARRAKRELIITWNTGQRDDDPRQAAAAFLALYTFWESKQRMKDERFA